MSRLIDEGLDPLLSSREVADLLGVVEPTVDRWRKAGRLAAELQSGAYRYRTSVVQAILGTASDPRPEAAG